MVNIIVSSQGVKNYTVKTQLKYPATILTATGFAFAKPWIALNQPGYDLTDNTNGVLFKTAGYPQGISTDLVFGTATFRAKQSGAGTIAVGSESLALDENSQNVYSGFGSLKSASVTVAATPTLVETTAVNGAEPELLPIVQEEAPPLLNPSLSPEASPISRTDAPAKAQPTTILSSIGNVFNFLDTGNWLIVLILILALAYTAFWLIKRILRRK